MWHVCRCSNGRNLERLQERGLRAVYRDKHASYQQFLEKAELPTLLNRHLQDICILMYKVKYNIGPTYIHVSVIFSIIIILLILYDSRISLFLNKIL